MTKLKFSKTRIVYWESNRSSLKLPVNANTLPVEVTLLADNPALPYRIASVIGKDATTVTTGHQWHTIPYNQYGLYCTPSEINALYENSNSFTPISVNYVIGHTIPLSRTATSSTTQLSFNNTIYSLICDLPGQDHITIGNEFGTVQDFSNFCRTYDGSRYDNLERAVLPTPPILFKVPRVKSEGTYWPALPGQSVPAITTNYKNFEWATGLPQGYTQNGAVNAYLPELLQNNSMVKVLYPGENQDMFQLDLSSYKLFSTIPCDSINFNETFANLDSRASLINTNLAFPSSLISFMTLVPQLRGPQDLFVDTTDTPYANIIGATGTDTQKLSKVLWSEVLQSKNGMTHDNCFTEPLPYKFIKCLPIMAQDNNVVNHTICGTVTWTIEIETTDRLYKNINPYKWEMLWPVRHMQPTVVDGVITGILPLEGMASSTGLRPLNDQHWTKLQLRRRAETQLAATSTTNPNNTSFRPTIATVNDVGEAIPEAVEQDIGFYTSAEYNDLHTKAFTAVGGAQLRKKRHSKRLHDKLHAHSDSM